MFYLMICIALIGGHCEGVKIRPFESLAQCEQARAEVVAPFAECKAILNKPLPEIGEKNAPSPFDKWH
jgi:hypothetical protein